jgi:hypothetical protein
LEEERDCLMEMKKECFCRSAFQIGKRSKAIYIYIYIYLDLNLNLNNSERERERERERGVECLEIYFVFGNCYL